MNSDTLQAKVDVPNGVLPQCELYATNSDIHTSFAVCPDLTHELASRGLHSRDDPHSHVLAIRNTAVCEAPTDFHERLACGQYNWCLAFSFFMVIGISWLTYTLRVRKQKTFRLDEEDGAATRPGLMHVPSTNSSAAKYREDVLKVHQDRRHAAEIFGTKQYQPVAWRYSCLHAARANIEGRVEHDAGPVAGLPGIDIPKGV